MVQLDFQYRKIHADFFQIEEKISYPCPSWILFLKLGWKWFFLCHEWYELPPKNLFEYFLSFS